MLAKSAITNDVGRRALGFGHTLRLESIHKNAQDPRFLVCLKDWMPVLWYAGRRPTQEREEGHGGSRGTDIKLAAHTYTYRHICIGGIIIVIVVVVVVAVLFVAVVLVVVVVLGPGRTHLWAMWAVLRQC